MPTSPLALVLMSHDIQALIGVEAHRVLMVEYGVAVTGDLELDEAIAVLRPSSSDAERAIVLGMSQEQYRADAANARTLMLRAQRQQIEASVAFANPDDERIDALLKDLTDGLDLV
jgi:hypothetical protein